MIKDHDILPEICTIEWLAKFLSVSISHLERLAGNGMLKIEYEDGCQVIRREALAKLLSHAVYWLGSHEPSH